MTDTATPERPGTYVLPRLTPEQARELQRRGQESKARKAAEKARGSSSDLRSRLTSRLAAVVDGDDIDTVIKAAPTIRMLTEDAGDQGDAPDPLAARYRALGYEPPY